jgi:hypothetical protein
MKIIGFNYTKLHAERPHKIEKISKISANISFTEIEKEESELIKSDTILKISFKYEVDYEKSDIKITCEGILFLALTQDEAKEVMKKWKKKEISENLRLFLSRHVWHKCTLKSLQLEEELNIPTHIPMPQISFSPNQNQK